MSFRPALSMLVVYDEEDIVLNVLPSAPKYNDQGEFMGLIDFEAYELAGEELTQIWSVEQVRGGPGAGPPTNGWTVCPGGWVHGQVEGSPSTPEPCPGGEQRRMAKGSKTWPEWAEVRGFKAERTGPPGRKRITALIHPRSGYRRERAETQERIEARVDEGRARARENGVLLRELYVDDGILTAEEALEVPDPELEVDLREVLGGIDTPLILDSDGRTIGRGSWSGSPADLPLADPGRLQDAEQPRTRAEGDRGDEPPIDRVRAIPPGE